MNLASTSEKVADYIRRWGQPLSVTRPNALGTPPSTLTIQALPQPLSQMQAERMRQEGQLNADAAYPTWFVCAAATDIREDDLISYAGFQYRVVHVPRHAVAGTVLLQKAVAVREQQ